MTDIYITSFFRRDFIGQCINQIYDRTEKNTFQIHIFDNGSDQETKEYLISLLNQNKIVSLHLDLRNTGCLYNKGIFHLMTEISQPYYIVTDNDILPPKLFPDWLSQLISLMNKYLDLAMLSLQVPPVFLQEPYEKNDDLVYCKSIGNTFKIVRREAFPLDVFQPELMKFGDDGWVCKELRERGWKIAYCRNLFCYNLGQKKDWGYKKEEIDLDPRKKGMGKPLLIDPINMETYETSKSEQF